MNKTKMSFGLMLFAALAVFMLVARSVQAENENPGIAPIGSSPGGNSYGEWGAEWWQWAVGIPFVGHPLVTPDGPYPLVNQEQCPVVFLTGTWLGSSEWWVSVKPGTKLYVPMLNYLTATIWDLEYGAAVAVLNGWDPDDFGDGELIQMAADHWLDDSATSLTLVIDGEPVENPNQYRSLSEPFVIEDDVIGFGLTGVTAANAGYAVMLNPLEPGDHEIFVDSYIDPPDDPPPAQAPFSFDVTFHVSVEPGAPSACGD